MYHLKSHPIHLRADLFVVPDNYRPERKRLYQIRMGMGYLEVPQVELQGRVLRKEILAEKSVFILDCTAELFLWVAKGANRLVSTILSLFHTFLFQRCDLFYLDS